MIFLLLFVLFDSLFRFDFDSSIGLGLVCSLEFVAWIQWIGIYIIRAVLTCRLVLVCSCQSA